MSENRKSENQSYTFTLTNSYHGTACRVPVGVELLQLDQREAWMDLQNAEQQGDSAAARTCRRVRRTLCGVRGCVCGVVRPI